MIDVNLTNAYLRKQYKCRTTVSPDAHEKNVGWSVYDKKLFFIDHNAYS